MEYFYFASDVAYIFSNNYSEKHKNSQNVVTWRVTWHLSTIEGLKKGVEEKRRVQNIWLKWGYWGVACVR